MGKFTEYLNIVQENNNYENLGTFYPKNGKDFKELWENKLFPELEKRNTWDKNRTYGNPVFVIEFLGIKKIFEFDISSGKMYYDIGNNKMEKNDFWEKSFYGFGNVFLSKKLESIKDEKEKNEFRNYMNNFWKEIK